MNTASPSAHIGVRQFVEAWLGEHLHPSYHYHNWAHAVDVADACARLGRVLKLDEQQLRSLELAAIFHDTGWARDPDGHERASAEIAREYLPTLAVDTGAIEQVASLILATRMPQNPANLMEQILCDADLAYLGAEHYPERTQMLRRELAERGTSYSDLAWLKLQVDFLSKHHYFTPPALAVLEPVKQTNLRRVLSLQEETSATP
jgi:predicted metal-dependent HD superfamily phosphohydrolase